LQLPGQFFDACFRNDFIAGKIQFCSSLPLSRYSNQTMKKTLKKHRPDTPPRSFKR